jgi:EmrB/QacA subfamily drug resistance transporter
VPQDVLVASQTALAAPPPQRRSDASRPAPTATSPGRATPPNEVLAIVCVGMVLANLDLFIVNVALPNIALDFHEPNLENLSWILNGYAIVYAALLVFFGRLAERYHRNHSFLIGVAIFTAASAACSAANGVVMLVAFRLVQAAGAALMTPTSLGLLLATFPPDKRLHAVRAWTAVGGFAAALGPLVGGVLMIASWRWIFLINVPIGIIALVMGYRKLPDVPGHDVAKPDPWAAATVTFGIVALTFGITRINDWGWNSRGVGISLGIAVLLLGLFCAHCLRSRNPFIDPALFRLRAFTGASLVIAPFMAAFGAMLLSVALWMQVGWGWTALKTGIAIAPGPFLVPVTSFLLAGRLIARFGVATVVAIGLTFFAGGLVWWALIPGLEPNLAVIMFGMVFTGIGVGLTVPTLFGAGTSSLPPSLFATGSGVINMIRQTAMAIGVAMFVAIVGTVHSPLERLAAYQRGWWIMAGLTALGFIPMLLLIRPKPTAVVVIAPVPAE